MRRKMTTFGHITRHHSLTSTILHRYFEGKRKRGRQKRNWINDIFEFSNLSLRQLLILQKIVRNVESCYHYFHVLPPTMATSWD